MKKSKILVTAAALIAAGFAVQATAQSCTSPSPLPLNNPASAPAAAGNSCTDGGDYVAQYCGGIDSSGKNDVMYTVTLAASGASRTATTITVGGGAAGFTPSAFLYTAGCDTGDGCVGTGDTTTPMDLTPVGAGTYFLGVSGANFDAVGACGAFTLTANGTLPVALQNFSVE